MHHFTFDGHDYTKDGDQNEPGDIYDSAGDPIVSVELSPCGEYWFAELVDTDIGETFHVNHCDAVQAACSVLSGDY